MTTDELQSMADNTRARQIENEHAAQVQQAKAEEREEREQAGLPRYALNDELTIRTPEGEELTGYVTNEEDEDGNIEVYFNQPYEGKKVHLFTKDYLDGVVVGMRLSPESSTTEESLEALSAPASPALSQVQPVVGEAMPANGPIHEGEETDIIGRSMTEEEAEAFLDAISENPEVVPVLELTAENWDAEFGKEGIIASPIGDVKMGENQFLKMMREGRNEKLGMIRPTIERPDVILEDTSRTKEGEDRVHSYVFVKSVKSEGKERLYYFTSVSISKDGREVVISNQERRKNRIVSLLTSGTVLYLKPDSLHPLAQVEGSVSLNDSRAATQAETITAPHGIHSSEEASSANKGSESPSHADPNDEGLSAEEAYEAVVQATQGDVGIALMVIESTVADKEKALGKAKKAKPRSADTIEGKIQALAEVSEGIEAAEASLAHWKAVAEIATEHMQGDVVEEEATQPEAEGLTGDPVPEEKEVKGKKEDVDLTSQQANVPEWNKDTPADARARGYIKVANVRVDRQGELTDVLIGKESDVKFATNDTQHARYAIIEAESLQPSHIRGYQNQLHFIPEAQPKDRSDVVSERVPRLTRVLLPSTHVVR